MTTYAQDRDGKYIPSSQRPDGTWRKARRVKDGYIPQEEVPLYESKGKLFMKKPAIPVGMCPILAQEAKEKRQKQQQQQQQANPKAGMYDLPSTSSGNDAGQKRKQNTKPSPNGLCNNVAANKSVKNLKPSSKISATSISTSTDKDTNSKLCHAITNLTISTDDDLAKTIKKLRKKIREIEAIESKISNGELKKPDPDQLEKVSRKNEILDRLKELERLESK